ncbi:TonB-dependent siderophore receptor [Methylopila sp. M107]|uniref:TonB-dependent siderophore receptor n=1 Tax=Methylopila sp. M107 TaxID=1101190 RepID=UPI00037FB14E|nr:TonB-dependent siderophore receptor [Methylopila sp. M107]
MALEAIEVQGRGGDGAIAFDGSGVKPVEGWVPAATTTGTKTDTPLVLIPQSVGVIGRQQMDDLGAQKVDEATRYSAGVFSQPFGDDTDTNWFFIRGFDATQTGVYRDGMQLYSFAFGNYYQDAWLVERVEVLRGASAALYGGGNVGGIINYVSKRPLDADFTTIEVGIDNYPTAFAAFDVNKVIPNDLISKSGPLPPVWKYRVTGKLEGGDGYSKHEDGLRGVIQGAATYAPNAGTDVTFYANYTRADQKHGGTDFLPYYGTVKRASSADGSVDFGRINRKDQYSDPDYDKHEREQAMIGYELNHDIDDVWTVNTRARASYSHVQERQIFLNGWTTDVAGVATPSFRPIDATSQLARFGFAHNTKSYSFNSDNNLVGKFATGGIDHTLLLGLDYKFYGIDEWQASSSAEPVDIGNPQYNQIRVPFGRYTDESTKLHQAGVFIQDQARFGGGFIATLNGRYDRIWLDTNNRLGTDLKDERGAFSGRAGLGYEFENGLVPYVSIARTFNPLLGAIGTNVFKPETGTQYEAGIKYAPKEFPAIFTASIFDLKKQNVVTGFNSPTTVQSQLGEVRSRGIELEAQANLTENWKLLAAFTAYNLKILKGTGPIPGTGFPGTPTSLDGQQPFLVPEVIGSAFLDYTFTAGDLKGLSLGGGVRYIGKSEGSQPNAFTLPSGERFNPKVPSATLFDAAVRYKFNDNWKASVNVTNLADKRYVSGCQGINVCSYGEGRRALAKVSYTW